MENQLEKKREAEIEAGLFQGLYWDYLIKGPKKAVKIMLKSSSGALYRISIYIYIQMYKESRTIMLAAI